MIYSQYSPHGMESRTLIAVLVVVVGHLSLTQGAAVTRAPGCPRGWVSHRDSCYLFYHLARYDWVEAADFCLLHGSNLASIQSADEDVFIKKNVMSKYGRDYDQSVWLAGTDDISEGFWNWNPKTVPFAYTHWGPGQPDNNNDNHHEDCLSLRGDFDFDWHDAPCDEKYFPVCEKMNPIFDIIG